VTRWTTTRPAWTRYGRSVPKSIAPASRYQRLDSGAVGKTIDAVAARILARFPDRQLGGVALELRSAVDRANRARESTSLRKTVRRACVAATIIVGIITAIALAIVVRDAIRATDGRTSFEWLPVIESAVNDVAFAAIAMFFLLTLSQRLDRRVALAELYRLRSLAHVIDMHQLTKDPERLLSHPQPTEVSIEETMTASELGRYLDYCSELLSLVGKVAALYAQSSSDSLVLDTVSEIESLTIGLSRKIWQKISLLHHS
jgi:hypothetical protein